MENELSELLKWVEAKSKITDPKDREMVALIEKLSAKQASEEAVVEEPNAENAIGAVRGRPRLYSWEEYLAAGVGKIPATKVARKLRVSNQTVYKAIRENKPGFVGPAKTTATRDVKPLKYYQENGLGIKSDMEVAAAIGVTRERVRQIRVRFGIPKPAIVKKHFRVVDGTEEIKQKIDSGMTVSQAARDLGLSLGIVNARVKRAGIVPKVRGPQVKLTKEEVMAAISGTKSIYEAAEKLGLKHYSNIFRYIDRYNLRNEMVLPDGRSKK